MKDGLGTPQGVQQRFCHGTTCKVRQGAREGGKNQNEEKKVQLERGSHLDWKSAVVSDGEPAREKEIKSG